MASVYKPEQGMKNDTFEVYHLKGRTHWEPHPHTHDFYEIYFFISGDVRYFVGESIYQLRSGDILLTSPGEMHQPCLAETSKNYECIVIWINSDYLEEFRIRKIDPCTCFRIASGQRRHLIRLPSEMSQRIEHTMLQILTDTHYNEYNKELMRTWYLIEILYALNLTQNLLYEGSLIQRPSENVVQDVISYINQNYDSLLSLEELSSRFFLSERLLLSKFSQITGTSVHQYILLRRLSAACSMMAEGVSPTAVYQQCGFNNYSTFFRAFKNEYHMSPSDYLQQIQRESKPE